MVFWTYAEISSWKIIIEWADELLFHCTSWPQRGGYMALFMKRSYLYNRRMDYQPALVLSEKGVFCQNLRNPSRSATAPWGTPDETGGGNVNWKLLTDIYSWLLSYSNEGKPVLKTKSYNLELSDRNTSWSWIIATQIDIYIEYHAEYCDGKHDCRLLCHVIIYLFKRKGWHQKAGPAQGCFPKICTNNNVNI